MNRNEDPQGYWCETMSHALYDRHEDDVAGLRQKLRHEGAILHGTWKGEVKLGEQGFSAMTAIVNKGPNKDTLVVAFRGTVGSDEWSRYPSPFLRESLSASERQREIYGQWDEILDLVSESRREEISQLNRI